MDLDIGWFNSVKPNYLFDKNLPAKTKRNFRKNRMKNVLNKILIIKDANRSITVFELNVTSKTMKQF